MESNNTCLLFAEFNKICLQTALGFIVMGFIGFFVKLVFIVSTHDPRYACEKLSTAFHIAPARIVLAAPLQDACLRIVLLCCSLLIRLLWEAVQLYDQGGPSR